MRRWISQDDPGQHAGIKGIMVLHTKLSYRQRDVCDDCMNLTAVGVAEYYAYVTKRLFAVPSHQFNPGSDKPCVRV